MAEEKHCERDRESRRIPTQANPGGTPLSEQMLDRFMVQWITMDQQKTEKEEQQRHEDSQQREQERQEYRKQDPMLQLLIANQARAAASPPPQPPRLSLQKFQEDMDDTGAFLETFEATAIAVEWPRAQWSLYLRSFQAGLGMTAVSMLGAEDQG